MKRPQQKAYGPSTLPHQRKISDDGIILHRPTCLAIAGENTEIHVMYEGVARSDTTSL